MRLVVLLFEISLLSVGFLIAVVGQVDFLASVVTPDAYASYAALRDLEQDSPRREPRRLTPGAAGFGTLAEAASNYCVEHSNRTDCFEEIILFENRGNIANLPVFHAKRRSGPELNIQFASFRPTLDSVVAGASLPYAVVSFVLGIAFTVGRYVWGA